VPAAAEDTKPIPGWKYITMHAEETLPEVEKTQELVGITN